jgi:hypothetical protein
MVDALSYKVYTNKRNCSDYRLEIEAGSQSPISSPQPSYADIGMRLLGARSAIDRSSA